jgi:hypothetical protein
VLAREIDSQAYKEWKQHCKSVGQCDDEIEIQTTKYINYMQKFLITPRLFPNEIYYGIKLLSGVC